MQQAIPYKSWLPIYTKTTLINPSPLSTSNKLPITTNGYSSKLLNMRIMVSENAVIVFARRGCCMGHVVRQLLLGHGVNPAVYEVDEEDEVGVLGELEMIVDVNIEKKVQLPTVFIGGKLLGGLDKVMAAHISGELVPVLKEAGALWL